MIPIFFLLIVCWANVLLNFVLNLECVPFSTAAFQRTKLRLLLQCATLLLCWLDLFCPVPILLLKQNLVRTKIHSNGFEKSQFELHTIKLFIFKKTLKGHLVLTQFFQKSRRIGYSCNSSASKAVCPSLFKGSNVYTLSHILQLNTSSFFKLITKTVQVARYNIIATLD